MKRNTIFMLAYIAFVVICFIVRLFWDYPMWDNIVIAITISSVFFAYADMFHIIAESIEKSKELSLNQCNRMKGIVDSTMNNLRRLKANIDEIHEKDSLRKSLENYTKMRDNLSALEKSYTNLKIVNLCRCIENVNLFIAFLLLLCILVFQSLAERLLSVQSYATVLAFIMILLTPVVGTWIKERSNKSFNKWMEIEKTFYVLDEVYRKELEHYAN